MNSRRRLLEAITSTPLDQVQWSESFPEVPSPSWWASDNTLFTGSHPDHGPLIAKVANQSTWSWQNRQNTYTAQRVAGECGVGPKVILNDVELGVIVLTRLTSPWRLARLDDFASTKFRANLRAARREFSRTGTALTPREPLSELNDMLARTTKLNVQIDARLHQLVETVQKYDAYLCACEGHQPVYPSQGDALSSNIMVNDRSEVRLVGWGSANSLTSRHDIALTVAEAAPTVLSTERIVHEAIVDASPQDEMVVKFLAVAEQLRWALLMSLRAATDSNRNLDSIKYGLWQLTLAEIATNDDDFFEQLEASL